MSTMRLYRKARKAASKVYGNGQLEKAHIVIYSKSGSTYKFVEKLAVQFNPSEYSIQRGIRVSGKKPLGRDNSTRNVQAVNAEQATLSVSLYFDSYNELKEQQGAGNLAQTTAAHYLKMGFNSVAGKISPKWPTFDMNEDLSPDPMYEVNERFYMITNLIKYNHEEHEPPTIGFLWGDSMFFVGKMTSQNVQYTVFNRDGTPIRAKLTMSIVGEEVVFEDQHEQYPLESPDRTKQRTLHHGDQLWMMAQDEYGDVSRWKTIAEANGILNPRAIGGVVRLKVPSIR